MSLVELQLSCHCCLPVFGAKCCKLREILRFVKDSKATVELNTHLQIRTEEVRLHSKWRATAQGRAAEVAAYQLPISLGSG